MAFDFSRVTVPFRMQPGLGRVAAGATQLTPSQPNGRHLREKTAVLGAFASQALCALPDVDPGPILRAVAHEAATVSPPAFVREPLASGRERWHAPLLGWSVDDGDGGDSGVTGTGEAALGTLLRRFPAGQRATALLCLAFEEDFALLDGSDATVPWLAVCLPSRWAPEEKVGRHFAAIHAPVADNAMLVAASASLARLVTASERWERFVWTFSPEPRLHQHPARGGSHWPAATLSSPVDAAGAVGAADRRDAATLAAMTSFRSERQSFIPLAGSTRAIFAIHVDSEPLVEAVATPEAAARLHAALASMSPAVLDYKHLTEPRDRLLDWLADRAGLPVAAAP